MQTAYTTQGIVQKAAGEPRKSTFNDDMVVSISVKNNDGTTLNIWGKADTVISHYKQGDEIEYCKSGKEYIFFHAPQSSNVPNARTDSPTHGAQNRPNTEGVGFKTKAEQGAAMKQAANESARFYAEIFRQTCTAMHEFSLKDELLTAIATTQYIQLSRKF